MINIFENFNMLAEQCNKKMVHTHLHTEYSLLDGQGKVKNYVKRAKELGMTSLAITDHNHLLGINDFYNECKKNNIKPLLGCEMYYTPNTDILSMDAKDRLQLAIDRARENGLEIPEKVPKKDKDGNIEYNKNGTPKMKKITKKDIAEMIAPYEYKTKQYHILFIAKNQIGLTNLIKLQSEASAKCTYNGRYLCDMKLIEKYSEGLICTTACVGSYSAQMIKVGALGSAEKYIDDLHSVFKDDLYLEIQPLEDMLQQQVNVQYIKWSNEKNIKLLSANDCHYVMKEDKYAHDVLVCIGTGEQVNNTERKMQYTHDFWLRSYDEMIVAYRRQALAIDVCDNYMSYIETAINNTNLLAKSVSPDITLGSPVPLFPNTKIPSVFRDYNSYMSNEAITRLYKYLNKHPECNKQEYEERLLFELGVINDKGFSPYFICYYDLVDHCERKGIAVGPGRGSAAGSLLTFVLGITKVDPLKHDLLFFRFMTPDRTSLPDKLVA